MPQEYYFNGHLRWTFIWENPNCWAAFLSCLLAWLWYGQIACLNKIKSTSLKMGLLALYVGELGLWILLIKTYSRGGLISAMVAIVLFFSLHGPAIMKRAQCVWNVAGRVAIIMILALIFGFAYRLTPSHLVQDNSVLHRIELWKGALAMIGDSPFQGWGNTLGGMAYVNWYQPLADETRPVGFVNSYLEVSVEHGIQTLFLALVGIGALLYIVIKLRRKLWVASAGVCVLAWLICNLWSSLWFRSALWVVPLIAVIIIIYAAFGLKGECYRMIACALIFGSVITFTLFGLGRIVAKDAPFRVVPTANGDAAVITARHSRDKLNASPIELWIDAAVMGRYWGRAIRGDFAKMPRGALTVYAPWALQANRLNPSAKQCIYTGFQAELAWDENMTQSKIIILHPTIYPLGKDINSFKNTDIIVCLPEFDVSEYDLPWRHWAVENCAKLIYSPQGSIQIESDQKTPRWHSFLYDE